MKMPAQISQWMTLEEMAQWVHEAPTADALRKRLAIWLTLKGPFHAHRVSELLQVSKQAVWLWIKQYNQGGPDSLDRKGRGGRRRAYLSVDEEKALVDRLQYLVSNGQARKAKELMPEVLATVGQNVSVAYIYRLLQRHERKRGAKADAENDSDVENSKTAKGLNAVAGMEMASPVEPNLNQKTA